MSKKEQYLRRISLGLGEALAVATVIWLMATRQYSRLPMAIGTVALLLLPPAAERLLHIKMATPIFLLTVFYALGPMLGQCWKLYYTLVWWDKLLHGLGGVLFALVGLALFRHFVGREQVVMCAIFALCLSMAVSVAWEFCEFASDCLLGTDMQQDRVVTEIHSYLLGENIGEVGSIESITDTAVNGTALPLSGYLDIGLRDTMTDMLYETAGAVLVAAVYLLRRGKFSVISGQRA